jgi:predicted MFS family arabinose efflux permease
VGAFIAPSIAAQNVLVSRLAPAMYATEAFMWSSTFIVTGLGAGMALGGVLVEHAGLRQNFAVGAAIIAVVALVALAMDASSARTPRASRAGP